MNTHNKPKSEYEKTPRLILMHNPRLNEGISNLSKTNLNYHNFLNSPNLDKLYEEYDLIQSTIKKWGIEIVELLESTSSKYHKSIKENPNSIFTRDPVITIPWKPSIAIKSNMKLEGRREEPEIICNALINLGLKKIIEIDKGFTLEGGDVIPTVHDNKKILLLGYGNRSSEKVIVELSKKLIPEIIDSILALKNPPGILHLDSAFSLLNDKTLLTARNTYREGLLVENDLKINKVNPLELAKELGIIRHYIEPEDVMDTESCNMIPLGNNTYLSLNIKPKLKNQIEKQSGIDIINIECTEIQKGAGGIHCLTRPIY